MLQIQAEPFIYSNRRFIKNLLSFFTKNYVIFAKIIPLAFMQNLKFYSDANNSLDFYFPAFYNQ